LTSIRALVPCVDVVAVGLATSPQACCEVEGSSSFRAAQRPWCASPVVGGPPLLPGTEVAPRDEAGGRRHQVAVLEDLPKPLVGCSPRSSIARPGARRGTRTATPCPVAASRCRRRRGASPAPAWSLPVAELERGEESVTGWSQRILPSSTSSATGAVSALVFEPQRQRYRADRVGLPQLLHAEAPPRRSSRHR